MSCPLPAPVMTRIDSLPTELVVQILDSLGNAPPSASRLHDQPSPHMLRSDAQPLKTASLVSRRWRDIALPLLFQHVQWTFGRWQLWLAEPGQASDPVSVLPLLAFLRANDLGKHVRSLTLVVEDSLKGVWRPTPGDVPLEASFVGAWQPSSSVEQDAGLSFAHRHHEIAARAITYNEDNNWVWDMLFSVMDPRQLNIIASPNMLGSLLSRMVRLTDPWISQDLWNILSLEREGKKRESKTHVDDVSEPESSGADNAPATHATPRRVPCKLFTLRPWTSVLLNEGSFIWTHESFEFSNLTPPSILHALLGVEEAPNDQRLIPKTVKAFSYVAMFPLASHFSVLLRSLPPLEKLFVQVVPHAAVMKDIDDFQSSRLWRERNTCYSMVMRELLSTPLQGNGLEDIVGFMGGTALVPHTRNWRHLREFESGDAADKDAWDMAVQYVRLSGSGWQVEGEGVFTKTAAPAPSEYTFHDYLGMADVSSGEEDNADQDLGGGFAIFQENLQRLAFNGTANLPYSPAQQYAGDMDFVEGPTVDFAIVDTGIPGVHALETTWEGVVGGSLDVAEQE